MTEGRAMRVVQVVGRYAPERCGVAHYADRLDRELNRGGLTSMVACGSASLPADGRSRVVPGFPHSIGGLLNLLRAGQTWDADWLHLQFAPATFDRRRVVTLLPLLRRLVPHAPRIAVTIHEYGGWPIWPGTRLRSVIDKATSTAERRSWLDRELVTLLSLSDLAIVTNTDHAVTIAERSAALGRRLAIVPIGPNVEIPGDEVLTRDEARRWLGLRERRLALLFFGFVHPVKGVETLIGAIRFARSRLPRFVVWIVGGVESLTLRGSEAATYERAVRALITSEGVADVVELTGYLPDVEVAKHLSAADLTVLPFNHGATLKSGTLITCLCHGVPTVTTLGGSIEPLRHGENLWLVPPRDPVALADAIVTLANDRETRTRLSRSAFDAAAQFSWDAIVAKHKQLYLDGKPRWTETFPRNVSSGS
jgi:polysaccharide biosynthesis protein PslF